MFLPEMALPDTVEGLIEKIGSVNRSVASFTLIPSAKSITLELLKCGRWIREGRATTFGHRFMVKDLRSVGWRNPEQCADLRLFLPQLTSVGDVLCLGEAIHLSDGVGMPLLRQPPF